MRQFKTIEEWLATKPTDDEIKKVLNLIHRVETNNTRKMIWEKERYFRRLNRIAKDYKDLDINPPKELSEEIKKIAKEIEVLKKDLPASKPRAKKDDLLTFEG